MTSSDSSRQTAPTFCIDAGIEHTRCFLIDDRGCCTSRHVFSSASAKSEISRLFSSFDGPVLLTGKLHKSVKTIVPTAPFFSTQAVLWSAAAASSRGDSVAVLDLSASGFLAVGVDAEGKLKNDLLVANPRCGSGSGINLDRILRKLSIPRDEVDFLLKGALGEEGFEERQRFPVRTDRCGVFASSATISDKNQGIPVAFALATTLKSEVVKACKQIRGDFDRILLRGGVFRWQFARDCASDYFKSLGNNVVEWDAGDALIPLGLFHLGQASKPSLAPMPDQFVDDVSLVEKAYPAFTTVARQLDDEHRLKRVPSEGGSDSVSDIAGKPVFIAIDVGSTMAKVVVCPTDDLHAYYRKAYSNAGDTIETVQAIFRDLKDRGLDVLPVERIGITGSARYQVRQALEAVYPDLSGRFHLLVENYAHARGSVDLVHSYIDQLQQSGIKNVNRQFCLLVDVGGEDTKISSVDLKQGDLYDNAMNTKCSAGTGSLFDTLVDLFDLDGIDQAVTEAMSASKALSLNATCAVFLLESARKLQAEGQERAEILASAIWAITENMARSLWPQISMAENTIVLLHGQTMQSDPLPIAISSRLQSYLGGAAYCLIPEDPGFRACLGLIQTMASEPRREAVTLSLETLIAQSFKRQIVLCQGGVCGDKGACCYRSRMSAHDAAGHPFSLLLGGCAAINEHLAETSAPKIAVRDSCRDIWELQASHDLVSKADNRLVIPRAFAVSEWAHFFAALFEPCGIPVHVDLPREDDILKGQPHFRIDTCAPHIGIVGQMLRLAAEPHGLILAPQIEFLPGKGQALGRTCTVNQGGFATAAAVAQSQYPASRIELFHIDLKLGFEMLAHKLYSRLQPVYRHYHVDLSIDEFKTLVRQALKTHGAARAEVADFVADLARDALKSGHRIAVVVGREYVLNPGIYDSHVGRLLRDKGMIGIPSYVLSAVCSDRYDHLFWRNAQLITSIVDAVNRKELHTIVQHKGLKEIIKAYEKQDEPLPIVQVSTFLCGPDSVTNPLISSIMSNRPFLRIQSDAAIKELAHLENRMNTYVRQLSATGRQQITLPGGDHFEVEYLDALENCRDVDPQTDLICFPTLSDNRPVLAVMRSAGYDCLENYTDQYDLQTLIERGRAVAGDSVCAPLAAVYGDVLSAVTTFQQSRIADSGYRHKKRLLIFNNKGLGPCRQGQYVETHKLFLTRQQGKTEEDMERFVQFLVAHENEGFRTGFPGWVYLRGVQAVILQGVLHQILAEGSSRCRDYKAYRDFFAAYGQLKEDLHKVIETHSAPGKIAQKITASVASKRGLHGVIAFFGWGFHRNYLGRPLGAFRKTWCRSPLSDSLIRIHIDGEAYMRTAQFESLHQALIDILGIGRFHLTYTPLWGFLEYKLAGMLMRAKEGIQESRSEIARGGSDAFIAKRRTFMRKKQKRYLTVSATHFFLRRILASPLYRSAGIAMPEKLTKVLDKAKQIIPTRRPGGELIPYVGEAALKLEKGYDLILNIAPEGCMVSSMGEVITPAIYRALPQAKGKIQPIFSQQGDVDREKLEQALLQALGPERVYQRE